MLLRDIIQNAEFPLFEVREIWYRIVHDSLTSNKGNSAFWIISRNNIILIILSDLNKIL
jgi:hypothetical protein